MNTKWKTLIENFEDNGYEPEDIQFIVHFYDIMIGQHKILKKMYEEEKE